jgi:hypothetical protein
LVPHRSDNYAPSPLSLGCGTRPLSTARNQARTACVVTYPRPGRRRLSSCAVMTRHIETPMPMTAPKDVCAADHVDAPGQSTDDPEQSHQLKHSVGRPRPRSTSRDRLVARLRPLESGSPLARDSQPHRRNRHGTCDSGHHECWDETDAEHDGEHEQGQRSKPHAERQRDTPRMLR